MKLYHLTRSQKLPISQDVGWAFLSNSASLAQITPPWMRFADESPERPKSIYPGLLQVYRVRPPGLWPCRWVAEIRYVDAPHAFIDEQKLGPFAFWWHKHEIIPVEGGVEMRDSVQYAMPFGILGQIAHPLLVRKQLERLFDYRHRMLEEFFGPF